MNFKLGDKVVHTSDNKPRKMVVVAYATRQIPPLDRHNELVNIGQIQDGSYYCTWINGDKKGEGYFSEIELNLQPID